MTILNYEHCGILIVDPNKVDLTAEITAAGSNWKNDVNKAYGDSLIEGKKIDFRRVKYIPTAQISPSL